MKFFSSLNLFVLPCKCGAEPEMAAGIAEPFEKSTMIYCPACNNEDQEVVCQSDIEAINTWNVFCGKPLSNEEATKYFDLMEVEKPEGE